MSLATWMELTTWLAVAAKSTVILAAAWLGATALRRASAARRHVLWLAALAGLAVLPVLSLLLPERQLAWLPTQLAGVTAEPAPESTAILETKPPQVTAPVARGLGRPAPPAVSPTRLPWGLVAVGLWGLVALVLCGRLALGIRGLYRLTSEAKPLLPASRQPFAGRLPAALLTHPRVTAPATWGWRRPVILLPPAARCWSSGELSDVVAHEMAHIDRRDWLLQISAELICGLYWWQPLVWLARNRLGLEAERACDDRVLSSGAAATDYAQRLLELARAAHMQNVQAWPATAMARRTDLSRRIAAILDPETRRKTVTRFHISLAAVLTAVLLFAVAPSHLVQAAGDPAESSSSASPAKAPPLFLAIAEGDGEGVKRLIAAGVDVEQRIPRGGTPLILAATGGHLEIAALLLEAGADPNGSETKSPRDLARTPLNAAAAGGHTELARLLLDRGAQVDGHARGDASALMVAARHGDTGLIALLLERGADASKVVRGDGTPLIEAARSQSPEAVELLLAAGADPSKAVGGDGSPLIQAASQGDARIVQLLLEAGANPDRVVLGDGTPLLRAARRGHTDVVRQLLDAGADPNRSALGDGNALMAAVRGGHDDIVEMLLEAGAKADKGVRGDGNALISAAARGDAAIVRRLLGAGADPDSSVRGDGNALIAAARRGHADIVTLLLDAGATIDEVVPGDENALIQAAGAGHLSTVELLISRGANVNKKVEVGGWLGGRETRSPLSMAERGGHRDVAELLRSRGAEG